MGLIDGLTIYCQPFPPALKLTAHVPVFGKGPHRGQPAAQRLGQCAAAVQAGLVGVAPGARLGDQSVAGALVRRELPALGAGAVGARRLAGLKSEAVFD